MLRKILQEEYGVLEAENSKEALEILWHSFDMIAAVLLDLAMPVMDDHELLGRMRETPEFSPSL
jgi:CheY-like chemotaxis protein